jgi:hypothetical protein
VRLLLKVELLALLCFCVFVFNFADLAEMCRWSNKALNGGCHHMRYCLMAEVSFRLDVVLYYPSKVVAQAGDNVQSSAQDFAVFLVRD